ncbi:MAG: guanylate kinase [Lachnospiraceae bacterium]|nr:guanylate kinase [Lachnospiraceae bacterium]
MGKIVYIMGKSSTGKDTIFKALLSDSDYEFNTIVSYTTRPIREGERNGVEYNFVKEADFAALSNAGKVVEDRAYDTCHGLWRYFTVADDSIDLKNKSYITIGTLESYKKVRDYYGKDNVIPVLIELDDGIRLTRALNREKKQDVPKYEEMCRRFLADSKDFDEELIKKAKIKKRFKNEDLNLCIGEIKKYLRIEMA